VGDGSWAVRVYDKPFINWIWFGCILMALGGFLALSDRRYRVRAAREGTVASGATVAAG
jgi:cytochrome c-type biogenesis protein CcmF